MRPVAVEVDMHAEADANCLAAIALEKLQADAALVARCVAGDVGGWETLYRRYHPKLIAAIECMLGRPQRDPELVDELAARVWYALIDNDGELLGKFDTGKMARLGTFVKAIAREKVRRYVREERRRGRREVEMCRTRSYPQVTTPDESHTTLLDFRETLTPGEKRFLDSRFADSSISDGSPAPSDADNSPRIWQLTSRLRRKLLAFFR